MRAASPSQAEPTHYDQVEFSPLTLTAAGARPREGAAASPRQATHGGQETRRAPQAPRKASPSATRAESGVAVDLTSIAEMAQALAADTPIASAVNSNAVAPGGGGPAEQGSGAGTGGVGAGGSGLARAFPEAPTNNVRCSWPADGEDLDQDFERVTVRVRVDSSGRMTGFEVLTSPSKMFSEAAIECTRQIRFEPARDNQGRPITAKSEPITVRFERYRPGATWR